MWSSTLSLSLILSVSMSTSLKFQKGWNQKGLHHCAYHESKLEGTFTKLNHVEDHNTLLQCNSEISFFGSSGPGRLNSYGKKVYAIMVVFKGSFVLSSGCILEKPRRWRNAWKNRATSQEGHSLIGQIWKNNTHTLSMLPGRVVQPSN